MSGDDVVFITIQKKDRVWINLTKGKDQNREERLHEVLENYRKSGLDAQYGTGVN